MESKFDLDDLFNPLTSQGEGVTVFISPYLSVGAPALGKDKGLMLCLHYLNKISIFSNLLL